MMRQQDQRTESLCAAPTDTLTNEKFTKILCNNPTNTLIHFPLVGLMHWVFCVPILPMESGCYRSKREQVKKERCMGDSVRRSYTFKRILIFNVDSMETEIHRLQDGGFIMNKKSVQRHGPRPVPIVWVYSPPPIHLIGHYLSNTVHMGTGI